MQMERAVNERQTALHVCGSTVLRLCGFSWWAGVQSKYFADRTGVARSPVISPWNVCERKPVHSSCHDCRLLEEAWSVAAASTGPAAVSPEVKTENYSPAGWIWWRLKKKAVWNWGPLEKVMWLIALLHFSFFFSFKFTWPVTQSVSYTESYVLS